LAAAVGAGLTLTGQAPAQPERGTAGAPSAVSVRAAETTRGRLVSAPVHLRTLSKDEAGLALREARFSPEGVAYGVDLYRLVYRTVDVQGRPAVASGLLVLPRNGARRPRMVSFTHGPQSNKDDAPSIGKDDFAYSPAITFGSAGFAAVAPDYLGLGKGTGTHPWMDVPSETTASVDMLRAARRFMARSGRTPQRRVLVTGFSQGASPALGLARALQDRADDWFRLGAVAPISGAYDFRDTEIPALLAGHQIPPRLAAVYTTYLFVSWNRLHHLYDSPGQVFRRPYAKRVDKLFDGTTPGEKMLGALPGDLGHLLTPHGLDLLRHPSPRFAKALKAADSTCTGWTPQAPILLYYGQGDEQAVTANTDRCQAEFRANGAEVTSIDLGAHDYYGSRHLGTAVSGTTAVLDWFTQPPTAGLVPTGRIMLGDLVS